jgi:hypothetical protein
MNSAEPAHRFFTVNAEKPSEDLTAVAQDFSVHSIDADQARAVSCAIEIQYDADEQVTAVVRWEDGEAVTDPADVILKDWQGIIGHAFTRPDTVNVLQEFFPEEASYMPHRVGGKPPDQLKIPQTRNPAGLQYVATLSPKGGVLPGWDHPLHVLTPLFLQYFPRLDLDYTDPMAPVIVNQDQFEDSVELFGCDYSKIKAPSAVRYRAQRFFASPKKPVEGWVRDDVIGGCGVPARVQYPNIPLCPKSGQPMQFIAQLESPDWLDVIGKPFKKIDNFHEDNFSVLNFWGDGVLYIFGAPDTRIVTTFIQNS